MIAVGRALDDDRVGQGHAHVLGVEDAIGAHQLVEVLPEVEKLRVEQGAQAW
jgi:hypothetical protein